MKFFKIFTIAIAALSVTACSDNDKTSWNTESDVTVEMGESSFSTKEGRGMVTIPLKVTGERNGSIKVTLDVISDTENPAKDEENLYLTTKSIVIFPEDDTYDVEVTIVDDKEMNEARFCDVVISSVEGATIGAQSFTTIEIKDNDTEPYDRAAGPWILEVVDYNGIPGRKYIDFITYDEGQAGYEKYYKMTGLYSNNFYRVYYSGDKENEEFAISVNYSTKGSAIDLNKDDEILDLQFLVEENGQLYIMDTGQTVFHIDPTFLSAEMEYTSIPGDYPIWGFLTSEGGLADYFYVTKMVRPSDY